MTVTQSDVFLDSALWMFPHVCLAVRCGPLTEVQAGQSFAGLLARHCPTWNPTSSEEMAGVLPSCSLHHRGRSAACVSAAAPLTHTAVAPKSALIRRLERAYFVRGYFHSVCLLRKMKQSKQNRRNQPVTGRPPPRVSVSACLVYGRWLVPQSAYFPLSSQASFYCAEKLASSVGHTCLGCGIKMPMEDDHDQCVQCLGLDHARMASQDPSSCMNCPIYDPPPHLHASRAGGAGYPRV